MNNEAWIKLGDVCTVIMCLLVAAGLLRALQGITNFFAGLVHLAPIGYLEFLAWAVFSWCFCEMIDRITLGKD